MLCPVVHRALPTPPHELVNARYHSLVLRKPPDLNVDCALFYRATHELMVVQYRRLACESRLLRMWIVPCSIVQHMG